MCHNLFHAQITLLSNKYFSEKIGDQYTTLSGYNEVAELNDIIVIYPQTIAKPMDGNRNGCWDW